MMQIHKDRDHVLLTAPAEDRETFRLLVARARSLPVYSNANDILRMRDAAAALADSPIARPMSAQVSIERVRAGDVECFWFRSPESTGATPVLYFHGGGFVIGSVLGAKGVISALATVLKAPILAVQYRQGPEHTHPAALEDAHAAYKWLAQRSQCSILVVGESAGAALAISAAVQARKGGLPAARGVIASSPWLDLSMSAPSWTANHDVDLVTLEMGTWLRACYLGGLPVSTPVISRTREDLLLLPPLLIQVGSNELALDDSRTFASAARAASADVQLEIYRDLPHGFLKFASSVGDVALTRMVRWVDSLAPTPHDSGR
jgi:acetyl esterase/lipase